MSKKSRNQSNRKVGFAYYVREGLSSVFVHGFTSLAAMLVIAACLMIPSGGPMMTSATTCPSAAPL